MRDAVAETILMLAGLLAGISLIVFVGLLSSKSHSVGSDMVDKEARQISLNRVAEAYSYVDISRTISGDDVVEFITDNGANYTYIIKMYPIITKDGKHVPDKACADTSKIIKYIEEDSDEYKGAMNAVLRHNQDMPKADAAAYASTALWSQYYLTSEVFGSRLTSKFRPVIYVNRSGTEGVNGKDITKAGSGWTAIKDKENNIPFAFIDVIGSEDEFVIVYEEEEVE